MKEGGANEDLLALIIVSIRLVTRIVRGHLTIGTTKCK